MALKRISTPRRIEKSAVVIGTERGEISILQSQMTMLDTEAKLVVAIQAAATTSSVQLPQLYAHKNRDGSFALAAGAAPKVWPEDETHRRGAKSL